MIRLRKTLPAVEQLGSKALCVFMSSDDDVHNEPKTHGYDEGFDMTLHDMFRSFTYNTSLNTSRV